VALTGYIPAAAIDRNVINVRKRQDQTMKNLSKALAAAGMLAGAAASPAHAEQEPFGEGFSGWRFTQEALKDGGIDCRAILKRGKQEYIMAMLSDGDGYVSVNSPGLKGKFPNSRLNLAQGPVTVTATASPERLVFSSLNEFTIDQIAQEGGYVWVLPKLDKSAEVDLGNRATDAINRVYECIAANS